MANESIMKGRVIKYANSPFNGTFSDTGKTYITVCTDVMPEVGETKPEVEVTNSCSTAEEYIAGFANPTEVTLSGYFRGSNAVDFGTGATTLLTLAKAGAIIAVKDDSANFGANPIIFRYDLTLLDWKYMGGSVKDPQKWMIRGRITGSINAAAV